VGGGGYSEGAEKLKLKQQWRKREKNSYITSRSHVLGKSFGYLLKHLSQ
jgi:hypothetical protein